MRWKKYCIDMDMTGITRKAAAEILADIWTIVNKVDTIYKEKCRVQLLSAVPSTILLFHLVSSFRENYAVSWHYRILRCIRIQITGVPAENDMFYG